MTTPNAEAEPETQAAIVLRLRAAGCVFAEDEAALIVAEATSVAQRERMVERRVAGEPLEVILGWAEFHGLRVGIDAGVFVPRHRTEFLVDQALASARPDSVVVDLCCGSGALGIALKAAVPGIRLAASDIEPAAVACARHNLAGIGDVYEGDLFAALPGELRGTVDILIVNAPYVPTDEIEWMPPEARDHEPLVALDGGSDGLDIHRRVTADALAWLAPGGALLIETSEAQADAALTLFSRDGLTATVEYSPELDSTVVIGRKPPELI